MALLTALLGFPGGLGPALATEGHRLERGSATRAARIQLADLRPGARAPTLPAPRTPLGPPAADAQELEEASPDGDGDLSTAAVPSGTTSTAAATPAAIRAVGWVGMSDLTSGCTARPCAEPPDPAIATGPSHVLHAIEHRLAIYDRQGWLLEQVALADLFEPLTQAAAGGYGETMPNVLWSPARNRWLIVQAAWDCTGGWLELAVSTTADPTAGWVLYGIDFGGHLPGFPALGASADTIVLSADHQVVDAAQPGCLRTTRAGASLTVIDWATLLSYPAMLQTAYTLPDTGLVAWRPAGDPSAAGSRVELITAIVTSGGTWHVGWAKLTGRVAGTGSEQIQLSDVVDLTISLELRTFSRPPAPRLPGGETLSLARDPRPTWSVSRGSRLWFVAARTCLPAGDTIVRSCVRVVELDVAGQPLLVRELWVAAGGSDTFGGAIGVSGDGTLFVLYARSSSTSRIRSSLAYRLSLDPSPGLRPAAQILPPGSYDGERWGSVVRLSPDPAQANAIWLAAPSVASGGWSTWVAQALPERSSPPGGTISIAGGAAATNRRSVRIAVSIPAASATTLTRCADDGAMDGALLANGRVAAAAAAVAWSLRDGALPAADGAQRVFCQFGDGTGGWSSPTDDVILLDTIAPTLGAATNRLRNPATLGTSTIPLTLVWTASDSGSGVAGRQIDFRDEDGIYEHLERLPAWLLPGHGYRFRVRVVDRAGNWSGWRYAPAFGLRAYQEASSSITYTGSWSSYLSTSTFGGGARYATAAGSSARLSFTGREVGLVSARGPSRGRAHIYLDGRLVTTVDLHAETISVRQLVFARRWSTVGDHTLRVVVEGTVGHPRVDLDAILVLT